MQLLIKTCEFPKNPSPRELLTRKEETRNIQSQAEPFVNHGVKFSSQRETTACARPGKTRANKMGGMASRHPAQETKTQLTAMLAAKRCARA
jgi:hypothetical protein